jgi:hypothetical protein
MAATHPQAEIQSKVLRSLKSTPFAAKSLVPLSGGTANFIYLADLAQPHDGVAQVLVKHGEGFLASNPGFQLPTSRCVSKDMAFPFCLDSPWYPDKAGLYIRHSTLKMSVFGFSLRPRWILPHPPVMMATNTQFARPSTTPSRRTPTHKSRSTCPTAPI